MRAIIAPIRCVVWIVRQRPELNMRKSKVPDDATAAQQEAPIADPQQGMRRSVGALSRNTSTRSELLGAFPNRFH